MSSSSASSSPHRHSHPKDDGDDDDDDDDDGPPLLDPVLFADPENYYPPSPPSTTQTYTTAAGRTLTLHLVGHSPTEAHHLWDGARVAAAYLEAHPAAVRGRAVLELGAGAGLPSLVAAALGAARVVMTDFPDADVVANMWRNIDAWRTGGCDGDDKNKNKGGGKGKAESTADDVVVAKGFVWGFDAAPLLAELARGAAGFDVVILADLLFRHAEHGRLLDSVRDTLARAPDSAALVFFTSYRPWLRHRDLTFFDLARERGFVVDNILEHKMEKPLFEDDPGDQDVRRTCTGCAIRWPAEKLGNGP